MQGYGSEHLVSHSMFCQSEPKEIRVSPKKGNPIVPFLLLSPPPTLSGTLCNIETVFIIAEELPGRSAIYGSEYFVGQSESKKENPSLPYLLLSPPAAFSN